MRSFVAALLVVLAGLCVAAAVPVVWAHTMLTDTDRFVEATAPLAEDPEVQDAVVLLVTARAKEQLGTDELAARLPPALRRLGANAGQALDRLIEQTVRRYVTSPQFADLWPELVRSAHEAMATTLEVDGADAGAVTVDLTPVVREVQAQLTAAGVPLVDQVEVQSVRVPVTQASSLEPLRPYVGWLDPASVLLPVAGAFLLLLGLALSRNRSRSLALAALSCAAGVGLGFLGLRTAKPYAVDQLAPALLPPATRAAAYQAATADLRTWLLFTLAGAGATLALVVLVAALGRARRLAS